MGRRIEVSINAHCRYALTEHGAAVWNQYYVNLFAGSPHLWANYMVSSGPVEKALPLWDLMHVFGPKLDAVFVDNLLTIEEGESVTVDPGLVENLAGTDSSLSTAVAERVARELFDNLELDWKFAGGEAALRGQVSAQEVATWCDDMGWDWPEGTAEALAESVAPNTKPDKG